MWNNLGLLQAWQNWAWNLLFPVTYLAFSFSCYCTWLPSFWGKGTKLHGRAIWPPPKEKDCGAEKKVDHSWTTAHFLTTEGASNTDICTWVTRNKQGKESFFCNGTMINPTSHFHSGKVEAVLCAGRTQEQGPHKAHVPMPGQASGVHTWHWAPGVCEEGRTDEDEWWATLRNAISFHTCQWLPTVELIRQCQQEGTHLFHCSLILLSPNDAAFYWGGGEGWRLMFTSLLRIIGLELGSCVWTLAWHWESYGSFLFPGFLAGKMGIQWLHYYRQVFVKCVCSLTGSSWHLCDQMRLHGHVTKGLVYDRHMIQLY